ncbi:hypothetical protein FIBSPDRAFT_943934 [Athelia psychrophila]|uniref:Uncharacterized protein n=1 Tax=Athelia psychrophila TaxID=1759441 RepID=A0A166VQQ6_9AGAM|nr:hypothetical protein FIBSPDRAFT_943934 [Fibularhizoctonia sp. CBS 109695]
MRALSSIFGAKRSEKPSPEPSTSTLQPTRPTLASKKSSRIFGSMSRKPSASGSALQLADPASLRVPALPALSSSSESSAGSHSLTTPGDDEGLVRTSSKASWRSWLGSKKPVAAVVNPQVPGGEWDVPRQAWKSRPPPVLLPPPFRGQSIDETDEESEEEGSSESSSISPPLATASAHQQPLPQSRANVRPRLKNRLRPIFSPPPLLHVPGQAMYPRSSNKRSSLLIQESMESRMCKSRLLKRAEQPQLARFQELELLKFHVDTTVADWPSCQLDDQAPLPTYRVRTYSQGLQKWGLRPCFEDRLVVWTSDAGTGTISCGPVTGTNLGVAALEISMALDALAGAIVDEAEIALIASGSSTSLLLPAASGAVQNSSILPSPLRTANNTLSLPSAIRIRSATVADMDVSSAPVIRRGVRFADDDKEDQIPLGHILRIKKKKEDRAQFLRDEKARKLLASEQAAERQLHEAERMQWEKERRQWEMEKRAVEEEKRKQTYAQEVLLTRQRREASRSGFYVPTPGRDTARPQLRESKSTPARDSSYLHPHRQASDQAVGYAGYGSQYSSPASSNPPSNNGGSPNASGFFSRPESIGSANTTLSSTEDVRQKKNASRRTSFVPELAQQQMFAVPYFPVWGTPYAVPAMPQYANLDMPLLPPAPPFMMQQARRSQSPHSQSRSHSRSASPKPVGSSSHNGSSDRLSHRSSVLPARPDSLQYHRRQSSDDAILASQRLAASSRRTGSTTDIHDRQSVSYHNNGSGPHTPVHLNHPSSMRPQGAWATTSLPRGRPPASRRESVIT